MKSVQFLLPSNLTSSPDLLADLNREALRMSESRYRRLFETARDGILLLNADTGQIEDVNPYLIEMLGYSHAEFLGKKLWEVGTFADIPQSKEMFAELQTNGYVRYDDLPLKTKAGAQIAVEFVSNSYDCEGIKVIQCNIRNITGRKKAEQKFKDLLESAPDAMVLVNRDSQIVLVNAQAAKLFGWRREELLGQKIDMLVPERFRGKHPGKQSDFFAQPRARRMGAGIELFGLRKNGTEFPVEISLSPLETDEGTQMMSAIRDITERKESENRIAHLNRVYATLSAINTLIVRVRDREELYREACRIAVEAGGFRMSLISMVDQSAMKIVPVASAGKDDELLAAIKGILSSSEDAPKTMVARAIREKQAVVSNESQSDSRVLIGRKYAESGVRSMAVLPLIVADEAIGVLALYSSESEFFHEEEMKLLTELAGDIAFALDHIGKVEKIARLSRIQAVMSGINSAIVHIRNRQALFNEACRIAVKEGRFPFAWIGALDQATQDVTPIAWAGVDAAQLTRAKSSARKDSPRGQGAVGRAIRERRPVINNDILSDHSGGPRQREVAELGFHSQVTLPVYEQQAIVGTLTMYARERNFFDEEELSLLTELAENISFAVENIGTQHNLDKLARIRTVSSEINAATVRIRERKALLEETCRIAFEHGKFEMTWVGAIDHAAKQVQPVAWTGFSEEAARAVSWASIDNVRGTLGEAMQTRRASVRNNIAGELPGGKLRGEALAKGCLSSVCLPLVLGDSVEALIVLFAPGTEFFDEEELALLDEVARNISFALEHLQRANKIARLSRIQAVVGSINALIVRVGERQELFDEACRIAVEHGELRMAWIGVVDKDAGMIKLAAIAGAARDFFESAPPAVFENKPGGLGRAGQAVREMKVMISNDFRNGQQKLMKRKMEEHGINSFAVIPLIVGGEAIGVFALYSESAGFFDTEEVRLLQDISENIAFAIDHLEKRARLEYIAYYDLLTGLANRSLFLERVALYMRSAASGGHRLALFLIDLERFKNINDSLGRPAGDALLKQVAEWLTHKVGDANLLARFDADHYALVLPKVRRDGNLGRLVEKILAAFMEHPFRLNNAVFRIAAKVGVALFPDDGTDPDALFRNAEAALKNAKARGDPYLFYTQKMADAVAGTLALENQLREALEKKEFVLHYQPKLNLVSGKLTGAEALIRWNDPRTGLVPPGRFIPILEETGLIYEVGRWALRQAIEDYLRWQAAGLPAVRIAVNVSPLQLRNLGFIAEIKQVIGIDAQAAAGLELEITESLIMEDVKHNIASLQAIRGMGVTIAIDDFGTGFSSLSYLAKLPVDTLKIDRSFVIDMTVGPEGLALVSTIINLAHSLKLNVVAEGVETEEQSRLLRLLGCDEMQGFLFSKPVPAEIFETRFLAPPPAG